MLILAFLFAAATAPARAEALPLRESVETAKALMTNGQSSEAQSLLYQLAGEYPRNNDVAFLLDGVVRYMGSVRELTKMTHQANLERAIAALMIREVA